MISPEIIYAIITSILIITFSFIVYISIKKLSKIYGTILLETNSKILEIESIVSAQSKEIKELENKTNALSSEVETLSMKIYKMEGEFYGRRNVEIKKEKKSVEKIVKKEYLKLNSTEKTIIKLLKEGPRNTREIRNMLNLSREHIARELKHLFEIGLVSRHTDTKPFTYELNKEKIGETEAIT